MKLVQQLTIQFGGFQIVDTCDCGLPAVKRCSDITGITGLVRCQKPICNSYGCNAWCASHRHAPNTMGYATLNGSAEFCGFVPDGPGFRFWVENLWRKLTYSPLRTAQYCWQREQMQFPPPAPLPASFKIRVGYQHFKTVDGVMVKDEENK